MRSACHAEANAAEEAPSSDASLAARSRSVMVVAAALPPLPPPPRSLSPSPPPRVIEMTLRES